ncbi:hypothetical protein GT755_11000 [Herbidospora sp. NEAU-GS84]|uniref:WD40 repeat domain-containing protein n=1 Tax=Herbidospora solisilvae TaxID=2696284 RepID=A0A7C9MZM0_9ACTN|nr:hypothetical protein [Herbidospora solisilvae]NAS22210.1 hypothetical protein [Herbidospora solisilvae]
MKIGVLVALAATVVAIVAVPVAAQAAPHHGDSIRYASAKACKVKKATVLCGNWRLVTHHGQIIQLKDAQLEALDGKGRPVGFAAAPVAISGNGQKIAYFRKDGRIAVRTLGGGVTLLPVGTLPKNVVQYNVWFRLSDDGASLAVTDRRTMIFDTKKGKRLGLLPTKREFIGFSGDGKEILTSATDEVFRVYDRSGRLLRQGRPADDVNGWGPNALHADARTVATLVSGDKLVVSDLETAQVERSNPIKLPKGGTVEMLDWTGPAQVTLHVSQNLPKVPNRMTVFEHDTKTGVTTVRDRYDILKDTFTYAACGG